MSENTAGLARGVAHRLLQWTALAMAGIVTLQACSPSTSSNPTPTSGAPQPTGSLSAPPSGAVSDPDCDAKLENATATAAELYDLSTSEADPLPLVTRLIECLGIGVVPTTADATAIQRVASGVPPAVLELELQAVAAGLKNGLLITIDSVVDELRQRGATAKADGQPLTRSAFDNVIQAAATSDGPVRIIPTLLQAISRERAGRMALESLDPVWGDPSFDAFQMMLVYLGVEEASRRAGVAGVPIAGALAAPRLAGLGSLVEVLEFFWDAASIPYQMVRFSTCAQIVGGFATVLISWSPQTVWHSDGTKPDTTNLEATLTMAHQFSERESAMLELLGCQPPQPGGIGGKTVRWYLDAKALLHGSLTQRGATTDPSGNVQAIYKTIAESAPQAQRKPAYEKKEMVAVNVQVQDLLNDFPKFTAIYRTLLGTSTLPPNLGSPSIDARFEVRWYEPKAYTVKIEWTEKWKTGKIDEGTFNGRLDTPEECFPEEHELCLGGTGTVSGHRGGWHSCNPGIPERPQGSGDAEFHATIDGDEITLTAFAGFLNPLAGMTTVPITVPTEGGHYTGDRSYGAYCGSEAATHSYTYDLTLTPLTSP